MIWTNCDLFTHKSSRSYLNHLVFFYTMIYQPLILKALICFEALEKVKSHNVTSQKICILNIKCVKTRDLIEIYSTRCQSHFSSYVIFPSSKRITKTSNGMMSLTAFCYINCAQNGSVMLTELRALSSQVSRLTGRPKNRW